MLTKLVYSLNNTLNKYPFRGSHRLGKGVGKVLLRKPLKPIEVKTHDGHKIIVDPIKAKGLEETIYYTGTYEPGTLAIFKKVLSKGDIFVDVGANIGSTVIPAAKAVGKKGSVIAFEANSHIAKILKKNIKLNKLKNIKINDIALGDKKGELRLYSNTSSNRGESTLVKPSDYDGTSIKVRVDKIDNVLKHPRIKMIKIDVEGWELKVLKGAEKILKSNNPPALCVEYVRKYNENNTGLYNYIREVNNYKVYKLKRGKQSISTLTEVKTESDLPTHDNIFCFTYDPNN